MNDEFLLMWAQWGILNFKQYQSVLRRFTDLETAWKKIDVSFLEKLGFGKEKAERVFDLRKGIDFHQLLEQLENNGVKVLCIDDALYPSFLKSIPYPPVFLFVRGKLPPFHKSIGVVGTRQITDYGAMAAEKFVTDLVRNGFVINSGLAMGIDALAHQVTLQNNGKTVAVLGTGVDWIYPSLNRRLADRILSRGGAIVSEYPLGTPAHKHHFPARNRIISGLSRGVLIVEGGVKSGALITARYALDQGREVFAIPNNITKLGLSGTNHLIRRGEAQLVESVDHILEVFQMEPRQNQQSVSFSSIESELLECILNGGKSIDELTVETHYNVAKLSEVFIGLQLKGVVREVNRKWVII